MDKLTEILERHIDGGVGAYGKLMDELVEWKGEETGKEQDFLDFETPTMYEAAWHKWYNSINKA